MTDRRISDANVPAKPPSDSARGAIVAGIAIVAVFFGGLGGWSSVAPLGSAVVANAVVKVEGNRKSVQHLDGGIVKSIAVKEGDTVKEGDVLLVLDDGPLRADVDVLDQQNALLLAVQARLSAERDGRGAVDFPPELTARSGEPSVAAAMAGQRLEFANRKAALAGQQQVISQRIGQLQQTINGTEAHEGALEQQLASVVGEKLSLQDVYSKGLIGRSQMLDLERTAAGLRGDIGQADADIAKAQRAIGENQDQMDQLVKDRASEVSDALRDTQSKLLDVMPRLRNAIAALGRTTVRAPYSGTVVGLAVFSTGNVITPGQRILDIVPEGTPLVVEAEVAVADIADIGPGMKAEVHFTAYDQRILPAIHGTVTTISADRLTDERSGFAYYAASVAVDPAELASAGSVKLYPGMPATVMIPTGERTALAYLVGPFAQSFDRAFRQR